MITNLVGRNDRGCYESVPTADQAGLTPELEQVDDDTFKVVWKPRPYRVMVGLGGDEADVTTGKTVTFRTVDDITITEVRASLYQASSSGAVEFDLLVNGASIFSTTLTIDQGEKTSTTATTPAVLGAGGVTDDNEITIEVLDGGSGAKGAVVVIKGTYP